MQVAQHNNLTMLKFLLCFGLFLDGHAFLPTRVRTQYTRSGSESKFSFEVYSSQADENLEGPPSVAVMAALGAVGYSLLGISHPEIMHPLHLAATHPWHLEHSSGLVHLATQINSLAHCELFYVEPAPLTPMQAALQQLLVTLGRATPPPAPPPLAPLQLAITAAEDNVAHLGSAAMNSAAIGELQLAACAVEANVVQLSSAVKGSAAAGELEHAITAAKSIMAQLSVSAPVGELQLTIAAAEANAAHLSSAMMESAAMGEVKNLVNAYNEALRVNYDLTAAVQAFILVGMGDAIAQKIEKIEFDPVRTFRMGSLGLVIGGIGTSHWLKFLESQLPGHATAARVVEKALIDACFWAPIANGAYLGLTPLVEGAGFKRSGEIVRERFAEVMKTELKTFTPYNLVAFSLIPPLLRPFSTGFVSMCFGVYISYVTHLTSEAESPPISKSIEVDP